MYPVATAASVNGTLIFIKSLALTSYPSFFRIPREVIFADAPIGVRLPPSVAPATSPKYSTVGSIFRIPTHWNASPATSALGEFYQYRLPAYRVLLNSYLYNIAYNHLQFFDSYYFITVCLTRLRKAERCIQSLGVCVFWHV